MSNFIEDYLQNPSLAILNARERADRRFADIDIDDELVYDQLASPEFRLYEEICRISL